MSIITVQIHRTVTSHTDIHTVNRMHSSHATRHIEEKINPSDSAIVQRFHTKHNLVL